MEPERYKDGRWPFSVGAERYARTLALLNDGQLDDAYAAFIEWDDEADEDDFITFAWHFANWCDITRCSACNELMHTNDTSSTQDEGVVCNRCADMHFTECVNCCELVRDFNIRRYHDDGYCEYCFSEAFTYCEHCDDYQPADDHDFDHEDDQCQCEAPHMCFHFPANGHGTIGQDERLTVELAAGIIDDEGMRRIASTIANAMPEVQGRWYLIPQVVEEVGAQWQTKRGNFTRRLSSALYRKGLKMSDGLLSEVGNLARAHSSTATTWNVEVTRDLNLPAYDFWHGDSCWWGGYAYSRCALKSWGGLALRTFESPTHYGDQVSGRAWIQPLARDDDGNLVPTHDTMGAVAYVVYNGYGNLDGYTGTRIVAHLTSLSYRKITLNIDRQYVNGNSGYLVADEATCQAIDSLRFSADEHDTLDAGTLNYNAKVAS